MGSLINSSTNGAVSSPQKEKPLEGLPLIRSPDLILVMHTPKGRGVFASRDIPAKTVVETSPVLVLDPKENEEHVSKTDLYNYTYNWTYTPSTSKEGKQANGSGPLKQQITQAVVLGLGSMFNHSTLHQNLGWERDLTNLLITYRTLRDVREGEELCISYGDSGRLTFKDVEDSGERSDEDWEEELLRTGIIDLID